MKERVAGLLLLICTTLHGQDKIFLKNGSVIRGTIGEVTDTVVVEISETRLELPIGLIEEIRFKQRERYSDFSYLRGWSTSLECGALLGRQADEELRVRGLVRLLQQYHFHPLLNAGIGMGWLSFADYEIYPVTFDYHAILGKSRGSLMLYGSLGHGFAQATLAGRTNYEVTGGLFYQWGLGWQQRIGRDAIHLKLGYAVQALEEEQELWDGYFLLRNRRINRITMHVTYVLRY